MCPIMGEYTEPEGDTDIATHAALTTTHGTTDAIADQADIATHAAIASAHHTKTVDASELTTGEIADARIPAAIARDAEVSSAISTHAALTTGVHGVGTDTIGKAVVNRLKGLTATLFNFTTNPTNLANITDEDWTTVSGTGVRICTDAWEIAAIRYDLGSVRTVLLAAKLGFWTTAGNIDVYFEYSVNGVDWTKTSGLQSMTTGSTEEIVRFCNSVLLRARYIGLYIVNATAGVTNRAKFYEFAALEFQGFVGSN